MSILLTVGLALLACLIPLAISAADHALRGQMASFHRVPRQVLGTILAEFSKLSELAAQYICAFVILLGSEMVRVFPSTLNWRSKMDKLLKWIETLLEMVFGPFPEPERCLPCGAPIRRLRSYDGPLFMTVLSAKDRQRREYEKAAGKLSKRQLMAANGVRDPDAFSKAQLVEKLVQANLLSEAEKPGFGQVSEWAVKALLWVKSKVNGLWALPNNVVRREAAAYHLLESAQHARVFDGLSVPQLAEMGQIPVGNKVVSGELLSLVAYLATMGDPIFGVSGKLLYRLNKAGKFGWTSAFMKSKPSQPRVLNLVFKSIQTPIWIFGASGGKFTLVIWPDRTTQMEFLHEVGFSRFMQKVKAEKLDPEVKGQKILKGIKYVQSIFSPAVFGAEWMPVTENWLHRLGEDESAVTDASAEVRADWFAHSLLSPEVRAEYRPNRKGEIVAGARVRIFRILCEAGLVKGGAIAKSKDFLERHYGKGTLVVASDVKSEVGFGEIQPAPEGWLENHPFVKANPDLDFVGRVLVWTVAGGAKPGKKLFTDLQSSVNFLGLEASRQRFLDGVAYATHQSEEVLSGGFDDDLIKYRQKSPTRGTNAVYEAALALRKVGLQVGAIPSVLVGLANQSIGGKVDARSLRAPSVIRSEKEGGEVEFSQYGFSAYPQPFKYKQVEEMAITEEKILSMAPRLRESFDKGEVSFVFVNEAYKAKYEKLGLTFLRADSVLEDGNFAYRYPNGEADGVIFFAIPINKEMAAHQEMGDLLWTLPTKQGFRGLSLLNGGDYDDSVNFLIGEASRVAIANHLKSGKTIEMGKAGEERRRIRTIEPKEEWEVGKFPYSGEVSANAYDRIIKVGGLAGMVGLAKDWDAVPLAYAVRVGLSGLVGQAANTSMVISALLRGDIKIRPRKAGSAEKIGPEMPRLRAVLEDGLSACLSDVVDVEVQAKNIEAGALAMGKIIGAFEEVAQAVMFTGCCFEVPDVLFDRITTPIREELIENEAIKVVSSGLIEVEDAYISDLCDMTTQKLMEQNGHRAELWNAIKRFEAHRPDWKKLADSTNNAFGPKFDGAVFHFRKNLPMIKDEEKRREVHGKLTIQMISDLIWEQTGKPLVDAWQSRIAVMAEKSESAEAREVNEIIDAAPELREMMITNLVSQLIAYNCIKQQVDPSFKVELGVTNTKKFYLARKGSVAVMKNSLGFPVSEYFSMVVEKVGRFVKVERNPEIDLIRVAAYEVIEKDGKFRKGELVPRAGQANLAERVGEAEMLLSNLVDGDHKIHDVCLVEGLKTPAWSWGGFTWNWANVQHGEGHVQKTIAGFRGAQADHMLAVMSKLSELELVRVEPMVSWSEDQMMGMPADKVKSIPVQFVFRSKPVVKDFDPNDDALGMEENLVSDEDLVQYHSESYAGFSDEDFIPEALDLGNLPPLDVD